MLYSIVLLLFFQSWKFCNGITNGPIEVSPHETNVVGEQCVLNFPWQLHGERPVYINNGLTPSTVDYYFYNSDGSDVSADIILEESDNESHLPANEFNFCFSTKQLTTQDNNGNWYSTASALYTPNGHLDFNIDGRYSISFGNKDSHYTDELDEGSCGGSITFSTDGNIPIGSNGWDVKSVDINDEYCDTFYVCKQFTWDELRSCTNTDGNQFVMSETDYGDYAEICGKWYVSAIGDDSQFNNNDDTNDDLNLVVGIIDYPFCFRLDLDIEAINHIFVDLCNCWWIAAYKQHPHRDNEDTENGVFKRQQSVTLAYVCQMPSFTQASSIHIYVPPTSINRIGWTGETNGYIEQISNNHLPLYQSTVVHCYDTNNPSSVCTIAGEIESAYLDLGDYDADSQDAAQLCDNYVFSSNDDSDYRIELTMQCPGDSGDTALNQYCNRYLRKFYQNYNNDAGNTVLDENNEAYVDGTLVGWAVCNVDMPLQWEDNYCDEQLEEIQFDFDWDIYYYDDTNGWTIVDYQNSNCVNGDSGCYAFRSGRDVVKVEITVNIPDAYHGEVIQAHLQNAYICWYNNPTTDISFDSSEFTLTGTYGCLTTNDRAGFEILVSERNICVSGGGGGNCATDNSLELIAVDSTNNDLWVIENLGTDTNAPPMRLSFRIPHTLVGTKIWIHVQIVFDYQVRSGARRRLLVDQIHNNKNSKVLTNFKHSASSIKVANDNNAKSAISEKSSVLTKHGKNIFVHPRSFDEIKRYDNNNNNSKENWFVQNMKTLKMVSAIIISFLFGFLLMFLCMRCSNKKSKSINGRKYAYIKNVSSAVDDNIKLDENASEAMNI